MGGSNYSTRSGDMDFIEAPLTTTMLGHTALNLFRPIISEGQTHDVHS